MINGIDQDALFATIDAVKQQPELAQVSFNLNSEWLQGCHQRATTGDVMQNGSPIESRKTAFVLESDEPSELLGTDKAASPAELILHALAGCYAVTYAMNAAADDIELSSLRLEMTADVDLQGSLNTNDQVRPGLQQIRIQVHATSPNTSQDRLEELTRTVEKRSPIRDTLVSPVEVHTTLVKD